MWLGLVGCRAPRITLEPLVSLLPPLPRPQHKAPGSHPESGNPDFSPWILKALPEVCLVLSNPASCTLTAPNATVSWAWDEVRSQGTENDPSPRAVGSVHEQELEEVGGSQYKGKQWKARAAGLGEEGAPHSRGRTARPCVSWPSGTPGQPGM